MHDKQNKVSECIHTIHSLTINKKRENKKMKTKEIAQIITVLTLMIITLCFCSWYESYYTREAIVTEVHEDVVIVVDRQGNEWSFIGDEFKVNDNVKLIMNTMHTENNIYDDVIEDVTRR